MLSPKRDRIKGRNLVGGREHLTLQLAPEPRFLHFHFKLLLHFANILFSLITMMASNGDTSFTQTWFIFPGQCMHIIDFPGKKY